MDCEESCNNSVSTTEFVTVSQQSPNSAISEQSRVFFITDPENQLKAHRLITPEDLLPSVLKHICDTVISSFLSLRIGKKIDIGEVNSGFQQFIRTEVKLKDNKLTFFFIYKTAYGLIAISHVDPVTLKISSYYENNFKKTDNFILACYHFNTEARELAYAAAFDSDSQRFHRNEIQEHPLRNPFQKLGI